MSLTAALGDILKVNLTIQMELMHWNQDKGGGGGRFPAKIMYKDA